MAIRIMIVDDAALTRTILKDIFKPPEFEIVGEAKSGKEAVELYPKLKPDVITMDITMREMSGLDALKEIKSADPSAKIVMVSALGDEEFVKKAIEYGADDFVVKPFSKEKLIETVKKVVSSK